MARPVILPPPCHHYHAHALMLDGPLAGTGIWFVWRCLRCAGCGDGSRAGRPARCVRLVESKLQVLHRCRLAQEGRVSRFALTRGPRAGPPQDLLQDSAGAFCKQVQELGAGVAAEIEALAMEGAQLPGAKELHPAPPSLASHQAS